MHNRINGELTVQVTVGQRSQLLWLRRHTEVGAGGAVPVGPCRMIKRRLRNAGSQEAGPMDEGALWRHSDSSNDE